ncbi:hypothetical protein R3P38DRAFT_3219578 [Favolaschia claudopus]|uniref:Uncharacterized protein n=1 Tax=Favolaschia claudopus TaxID=2862362 RepID=A0AAW0A1R5_9AGAR
MVPALAALLHDKGFMFLEGDITFKRMQGELNEWEAAIRYSPTHKPTTINLLPVEAVRIAQKFGFEKAALLAAARKTCILMNRNNNNYRDRMRRNITRIANRQSYCEEHDNLGEAITNAEQIVAETKQLQKAAVDCHKAAWAELKSQKKYLGCAPHHSNSTRSNKSLSLIPCLVGARAEEPDTEAEDELMISSTCSEIDAASSQSQGFGVCVDFEEIFSRTIHDIAANKLTIASAQTSQPDQRRILPADFFLQATASNVTGIPFPLPDTGESLNISEEDLRAMLYAPGFDFDEFMAGTQESSLTFSLSPMAVVPSPINHFPVGPSPMDHPSPIDSSLVAPAQPIGRKHRMEVDPTNMIDGPRIRKCAFVNHEL